MSPVMLVMGVSAWFVLDFFQVDNWLVFFGAAVVYSVVYFTLAYWFMMNRYERDIIQVPVKKVLRKLKILK